MMSERIATAAPVAFHLCDCALVRTRKLRLVCSTTLIVKRGGEGGNMFFVACLPLRSIISCELGSRARDYPWTFTSHKAEDNGHLDCSPHAR